MSVLPLACWLSNFHSRAEAHLFYLERADTFLSCFPLLSLSNINTEFTQDHGSSQHQRYRVWSSLGDLYQNQGFDLSIVSRSLLPRNLLKGSKSKLWVECLVCSWAPLSFNLLFPASRWGFPLLRLMTSNPTRTTNLWQPKKGAPTSSLHRYQINYHLFFPLGLKRSYKMHWYFVKERKNYWLLPKLII